MPKKSRNRPNPRPARKDEEAKKKDEEAKKKAEETRRKEEEARRQKEAEAKKRDDELRKEAKKAAEEAKKADREFREQATGTLNGLIEGMNSLLDRIEKLEAQTQVSVSVPVYSAEEQAAEAVALEQMAEIARQMRERAEQARYRAGLRDAALSVKLM